MWNRGQLIGTLWFFVVLTSTLVAIRLRVRLTTVYRPWRELLVVFAWLCNFAIAIAEIFFYYRPDMWAFALGQPVPDSVVTWAYKISFAFGFLQTSGLNACKAVLLLTYLDLCHRHTFPILWWSIIVTSVVIFVCEVGVALVFNILQCLPNGPGAYWSATELCDDSKFLLAMWVTNSATDVIITIIPIFIVAQLHNLTFTKKVGVYAMFAVGFCNVGLVIFLTCAYVVPGFTSGGTGAKVFSNLLILPTAIIVLCVPQLRVLGRWKFGRKVVASIYRSVGGGTIGATTAGTVNLKEGDDAEGKMEPLDLKATDEETSMSTTQPLPVYKA